MKFLVMNGVNLNLTGKREKGVYGTETLDEINAKIAAYCEKNGDSVEFYQSNIEGELVNKLHEAYLNKTCDAIAAIDIPVAEVHISNVHARETFRHNSVLSEVCKGVVCGFGLGSYLAAIEGLKVSAK